MTVPSANSSSILHAFRELTELSICSIWSWLLAVGPLNYQTRMWQLCHKLLSASFCGCCQWWAHPFGALWSFLLWMTSISVSALSKKVNDRLIWRAVGRQNQTEAYLAIMKQSGNENGPLGSQMFVCKNYKWHISFVYLTTVCPISMGLIFTMPPSAISLCMWTWANVKNIYCIFEWTHWPAV